MSLNKVMLIGNIGRDPEGKTLDGNNGSQKVATFTLATGEKYKDRNGELRENTEWHNIVAWRNLADICEKYIRKGMQVYIEGRLRTREWTDKENIKRYATEIMADEMKLLGRRAEGQQGTSQSGYQPSQGGYSQPAAQPVQSVQPAPVVVQDDPDDLPF